MCVGGKGGMEGGCVGEAREVWREGVCGRQGRYGGRVCVGSVEGTSVQRAVSVPPRDGVKGGLFLIARTTKTASISGSMISPMSGVLSSSRRTARRNSFLDTLRSPSVSMSVRVSITRMLALERASRMEERTCGKAWEGVGRRGKAWEGVGRRGKAREGAGRREKEA